MKYYCDHCKTEYKFPEIKEGDFYYDPDEMCPICGNQDPDYDLIPIPDYETPEQWARRTGKPYRGDGLVFRFGKKHWCPSDYEWVKSEAKMGRIYPVVIADPPVPPPDNWRPE